MVSQCWLGDGIWNVRCIQFLTESFSTSFWSKILLKKFNFQINFCFIKSLARSACLKVMHITSIEEHFKQEVLLWVLILVSAPSRLFSSISRICQKISFPQDLSTLPKIFIRLYKKWTQTRLHEAHWIAWRSSPVLFRVRSFVDILVTVLFRCRAFSGRAERSLFAQGPKKRFFRFFPTRDLCVSYLWVSFPGTYWLGLSGFCVKLRRVHDLTYYNFSAAKLFGQFWAEKSSNIGFFRGQGLYFFSPVFTGSLKMLLFALVDWTPSGWAACSFFANFFGQFWSEKRGILGIFSKQIWHCPLFLLILTLFF